MARQAATAPRSKTVRRRKVFYVAGFDPASPRKYHGIFTDQSAKQAAVSGAQIEVGALEERGDISSGWTVRTRHGRSKVEIDYECLRWNDLVRQMWPKEGLLFFLNVVRALFIYRRRGVLALSPLVRITALAPVLAGSVYLILYAALVAAACVGGAFLARALGWPWWSLALLPLLLWLAAVPVWRLVDRSLPVTWLGRGMIAVSDASRGLHGSFEARLDAFAAKLMEAARDPQWDEVLVVGHSMGCQQAARTVGKALRLDPELGRSGPKVALLTLGQLIPLYSLMVDDPDYRADFAALAAADQIPWIDITGPSDPGSACEVHPLAGVLDPLPEARPERRSPRFHTVLTPATYKRLRRQPLVFHFQYLMATELPGGYDYFDIVTGPRPLGGGAAA